MWTRLFIALGAAGLCLLLWATSVAENGIAGSPVEPTVMPSVTSTKLPSEKRIKESLDLPVSYEVPDAPLKDALDFLSDKLKIPIVFDLAALRDAAIDPTAIQVGMPFRDISLRSALKLILGQYNLAYVIKDEVLQITTNEKAGSTLWINIYDVRDLVPQAAGAADASAMSQLQGVITGSIAQPTWSAVGGQGTIQPFCSNGICVLVIAQTQEVQEEIEDLLANLRTFKPQPAK